LICSASDFRPRLACREREKAEERASPELERILLVDDNLDNIQILVATLAAYVECLDDLSDSVRSKKDGTGDQ